MFDINTVLIVCDNTVDEDDIEDNIKSIKYITIIIKDRGYVLFRDCVDLESISEKAVPLSNEVSDLLNPTTSI